MSEPKLISPLLEGLVMGDPISDHHGVRCCPAMEKASEKKYIVKIISIPASQVQLEALLLSGAYASKEDALAYFKELADQTVGEAQLLQKLSRLEGFTGYEGWQVEPMEDGVGYDVYLLGAYRPTLERRLSRTPMTHLGAVNLGLDLCAALSVCRRNGYLCVDLKPSNVYIAENGEYRIGDLGFVALDSLKYASLPERCRSAYTAPEITDAYSALNSTLDIYAAGMILYQAYNNGELPTPGETPAPPAYADYEMAEIILKACAEKPEDRWEDPAQMYQALVSYMPRNGANDTPIVPPPAAAEPEVPEVPEEPEIPEEPVEEETTGEAEEAVTEVQAEEETAAPIPVVIPAEAGEPAEVDTEDIPAEAEAPAEDDDQFMIEGFLSDETTPSEESSEGLETEVSEEVSAILDQADDLIAHKVPDPVVAPEPIDIPIPEPISAEPEEPEEIAEEPETAEETPAEPEVPEAAAEEEKVSEEVPPPEKKKKRKGLIAALIIILLILLLGAGALLFYQEYYLQSVTDITLSGDKDYLTVTLDTEIEDGLLTVVCTDTYGNSLRQAIVDNQAHLTGLNPSTSYKISLQISGFHKLVGTTTATYTSPAQTNIVSFTAVTGDQDGSVKLNFSVQGPDNTAWTVTYSDGDESSGSVPCTGHTATITGLNVGSTYTFTLTPEVDLYVVGSDTLEYTASKVVTAENLTIEGFRDGSLTATWNTPEGTAAESWTVRCYNSNGHDQTVYVADTKVIFDDLDITQSYTLDVMAEGMSVSKQVSVSANSVTFTDIQLDESVPGQLTVTWSYEGTAPADGWRLLYTVDGGELQVVYCEEGSGVITPLVPGGEYSISFDLPDGITVFGGTASFTAPEAETFAAYRVKPEDMEFKMCATPEDPDWRWYLLKDEDYITTFALGENASFVIVIPSTVIDKSNDEITTMFVIRDADGKPVSATWGRTRTWNEMWAKNYSELDMPAMPQAAGEYTVDIYFDGKYVTTQSFTVTE